MKGMIRSAGASAGRMMAWRVHSYEAGAPRLEEARVPALRAPDELLVRVRAASLNPIDVAMIGGYGSVALNAQRRLLGADSVEFPLTCGRDFCGVVEARGAAVREELRRGARVWGALPPHVTSGTHAQFVRVKQAWVSRAPGALRDAECAGAPYAALTAMSLLRSAEPVEWATARVLLLGLGGAGQAALQLLAARGAHVTVCAAREQAALARALGAREALDRHAEGYRERVERGGPYAAVLDCAGLGGAEAAARRWRFSRYVTLTSPLLRETDARGLAAGAAAAAAQLAAQCWRARAASPGSAVPVRWAFFAASADDLETLRCLAERGQFRVSVERVFGWREGAAAYERAARGGARGKLVIDFSDADTGAGPDAGPDAGTAAAR